MTNQHDITYTTLLLFQLERDGVGDDGLDTLEDRLHVLVGVQLLRVGVKLQNVVEVGGVV